MPSIGYTKYSDGFWGIPICRCEYQRLWCKRRRYIHVTSAHLYNGRQAHRHTALGRFTQCYFEVIVVDDQSSDETAEQLAGIKGLTHLRNEKNLGFVGSCNRGADSARGETRFWRLFHLHLSDRVHDPRRKRIGTTTLEVA